MRCPMESKKFFEVKRVISLLIIVFLGIGIMSTELLSKIKLPGEIKITIQENPVYGEPLAINIVAVSKIPFKNGHIEIIIPELGNFSSQKVELWSGNSPNGPMEKHLKYLLPVLSIGEFKLIAYFKFSSLRKGSREMRVSKALYIDVRSDKILSSNISFRQIKRLELNKELERHGLKGLRISEIKKNAPEIAKRILKLNKAKGDVIESRDTPKKNAEKNFIYKPKENKADKKKEKSVGIELQKAPLTSTKKTIYVSTQKREKSINDRVTQEPSNAIKAPTTGTKNTVSISTKQPGGLTKVSPLLKVAPHESTKKVVDIRTEGDKKKKTSSDSEKSNYKNSEQAKEKKKAMEKKGRGQK